ncbi:non-heme iron oxygenase ferredoxin subunit [Naumannella sp. ID2617S]|nr:non-heme iron oxygenase ferredoxin subunit [Naumannella sp. ID2617S]
MSEPVKIAEVTDVEPGQAVQIDHRMAGTGDNLCLARTESGEFFAVDNTCTHSLAWLADGWVEGDTIECPVHAAAFCLRTGEALTLPASEPVRAYQVEVRGSEVWLVGLRPGAAGDAP